MKLEKNNKKKGKKMKKNPEKAEGGVNKKGTKKNIFTRIIKWWSGPDSFWTYLIITGLVIVSSLIWFNIFEGLIQYLPPWAHLISLFVSTYIISSFFSKVVGDNEEKKRKLIKWVPILLVFIFNFLPSLDQAKVDSNGETLQWINIENGMIYHRSNNEIHEDRKGEFFFDPINNGDTCRKATEHWRGVYRKNNPVSKSVYVITYDTVVDKIYTKEDLNKDGYIRTHVYGYDINALENPEIVIINLKGKDDSSVVIARVKKSKKIYASYRNPVARYKYVEKMCTDVAASVAIDINGDSRARVLLLNKKRVRQGLAQN